MGFCSGSTGGSLLCLHYCHLHCMQLVKNCCLRFGAKTVFIETRVLLINPHLSKEAFMNISINLLFWWEILLAHDPIVLGKQILGTTSQFP